MSRGPGSASRCPDCSEPFAGLPERCPACGLLLVGLTAARLWAVDQSIAALTVERGALLQALRNAGAGGQVGRPGQPAPWSASGAAFAAAGSAFGSAASKAGSGSAEASALPLPSIPAHYLPHRPALEWSRRRVQNLLLSLGVLLLTVAALIFIAVNWGTLGAGGRATVMAVVTISAAGAAALASRRGLPATAESVAGLTVALLAVDAIGLRRTGFATGISAVTYSGAVVAVIALLTAAWSTTIRLRLPRICALIAAQLVIPFCTGTSVVRPDAVAAVYGLQAAALLAIRFHTRIGEYVDIRILRISTYAWWAFALDACIAATYGRPAVRSVWGLLELAALAAVAVWAARHEYAEIHLALATATAIAAACGAVPYVSAAWRAPVVGVVALLAAVAVQLTIPARVMRASTAVVAATGLGALLTAVKPIAEALGAPGRPWSGSGNLALLALTALGTATVLMPRTTGATRQAATPVLAVLVVVNLLLVPREAAWSLAGEVAWDLALGAALLLAATARKPEDNRVVMIVGAFFLVHGAMWSLRSATLTVVAVGVLCAVTTIAAAAWRSRDRLILATSSAVLAMLEAGLIAHYQGASIAVIGVVLAAAAAGLLGLTYVLVRRLDDLYTFTLQVVALAAASISLGMSAAEPATLATCLAFLIAGTGPALGFGKGPLVPIWPAVVQVLLCAEVDAVHYWSVPSADLSARALAVAIAAAGVTLAAHSLSSQKTNTVTLVTGPAVYALAVLGTIVGLRLDPIWIALLVGGAAAATVAAVRTPRAVSAGISALLILASSWVRLGEAHVHAVEPYTVPAALVLLTAGYMRGRDTSSWSGYGPGLALGLAPTLIQALTDPGLLRPALLGLAASAVLVAGIRHRLQAPLAIGGGALAIDALAQLSPYLADAYDAVPRWSLIAAAGALLLTLGVTYERRIRDVRALGKRFGGLR